MINIETLVAKELQLGVKKVLLDADSIVTT
jgi:hypothetical protein